ncbi:MAG: response regulator transcription factor [Acidimicrobiales bacterium]
MTRLLLVEDDQRISVPLARLLRTEGFDVHHLAEGADVVSTVERITPDLVLLDLSLPDLDGLDVCRSIRDRWPALPIVMLTARNEEVDIVVGLGAGADDYVTKPFRVGELVARIRARLRLAAPAAATVGDSLPSGLRVDPAARRAWVDGDELSLSPKEFDLLAYLAAHPGVTLKREQIMTDVWDEHWWGSTRTLDTHVASLRRKLGDTGDTGEPARFITTVRGVGLRLEAG